MQWKLYHNSSYAKRQFYFFFAFLYFLCYESVPSAFAQKQQFFSPPLVILLYANVSLLEMTDLEGREVWPSIVKKNPATSLDMGFVAP